VNEQPRNDLKRAAVIVLMEDGAQMVYEFAPWRTVTLSMDYDYGDEIPSLWSHLNTSSPEVTMKVEGIFLRGQVWDPGDPVFTKQQEINVPKLEIGPGVTEAEGQTP
jgi:hypothetical protein